MMWIGKDYKTVILLIIVYGCETWSININRKTYINDVLEQRA
jgi:hypothetical protein